MRKLEIGSLPLPTIYVCSSKKDVEECSSRGIPYIVWRDSYDRLVKLVLYPTLNKMFPDIAWNHVLEIRHRDLAVRANLRIVKPMAYGDESNPLIGSAGECGKPVEQWQEETLAAWEDGSIDRSDTGSSGAGEMGDMQGYRSYTRDGTAIDVRRGNESLDDAIGDISSFVNIEELQKMRLMPTWIGEIADVIRSNIDDYMWCEGWNRKLGYPAGNYIAGENAPNLIIVDASRSIPSGIAATLLAMAETMRNQANADLIVTASTSGWYPLSKELPSPDYLRKAHPRGQEALMFNEIIVNHVLGKEWANLVVFGDNDSPEGFIDSRNYLAWRDGSDVSNTKVHNIWCYHTHGGKAIPGYGRWAGTLCPDAELHFSQDWCSTMR